MNNLTKIVTASAVLTSAAITTVMVLDAPQRRSAQPSEAPDIAGPGEREAPAVVDLGDPQLQVELAHGGWVQVADANGDLAQQYRFDHLDPDPQDLPTHWLRMDQPKVQLFLSGGRVVVLSGDTLDAHAPDRALEEGALIGNVTIELFEPSPHPTGSAPSIDGLTPAMTVRTDRASFDNLAGRIECPNAITATTPTERMAGRELIVLLNDRDNRIEFLRLQHVDYLAMQTRATTSARTAPQRRVMFASNHHAPPQSAAAEAHWYQVQLDTNIRIEQTTVSGRRIAVGDRLDVTFSMDAADLPGTAVASASQSSTAPSASAALAWAALAAATDPPTPALDEILVTCDGPLTMVPLADNHSHPSHADAARLALHGTPVRLLATSDRLGAVAASMQYDTAAGRIDLVGDAQVPVVVMTDDVWLHSEQLWVEMDTGLAGADAVPGSAHLLTASPLTAAIVSENAAQLDPTAPASIEQDMSIEWTGGVDVRFDPAGEDAAGSMRSIRFNGDVQVRSADGAIDAEAMEMHFAPGPDGQSHPDRMQATGEVMARNADQTIWTDTLTATLEPPHPVAAADTAPSDDPFADARVKDFFAQGNVQVLLADGARAFADVLEGDARQEKVLLKGENIVVARSDLLIEHGKQVLIERQEGRASWPGGGRARLLARPIDVMQDHRITRPAVPAPTDRVKRVVSMQATWNDGLLYDAKFGDGAGALDLAGAVAVVSQQQPTERASLHGDGLRLEFATAATAQQTPTTSGNGDLLGTDGRVLSRMIASGQARLERRTWPTKARLETPEIIYIGGERITWDDLNVKASVEGQGDFVTRQPAWAGADSDGPFRGAGTARFTWQKTLHMNRTTDGRYTIDMKGMVEGQWKGEQDAMDIATLTADTVRAVTRRQVGTQDTATDTPAPLDFDGEATVERLIADGRVYLATPTRRADADTLKYNTRTGIARLEGRPGHPVAVLNDGVPLPVRATAMTWNMDPAIDTITLESPRGLGGL
ncbi:MAG: hypothetical protein MK074_04075 [Phycisphaerales bacterium]|nr:hypothetical protein [Phycisphaerales bacterium]